jgi:hypothetical protein
MNMIISSPAFTRKLSLQLCLLFTCPHNNSLGDAGIALAVTQAVFILQAEEEEEEAGVDHREHVKVLVGVVMLVGGVVVVAVAAVGFAGPPGRSERSHQLA